MIICKKQIQGNHYEYQIIDVLPEGWLKVESVIDCIEIIDRHTFKDLVWKRDFFKEGFVPNWNNLSTIDKKELVRIYCYPSGIIQEEWNSYFSTEAHKDNWAFLVTEERRARVKRWERMIEGVSYFNTMLENADLYLSTKAMAEDYKIAKMPHLYYWITNGALQELGIDFTTNGFAQKPYFTEEKKNILVDILIKG